MLSPILADAPTLDIPIGQLLIYVGGGSLVALALNALYVVSTSRGNRGEARRHWLVRLLYVAFLVLVAILAVSSFGPILQFGHIGGYALLAHIGAAGAFVFLLLAIALFYLPRGLDGRDPYVTGDNRWWLARWSAWTLIVASLVSAGTMFASMLPLADTQGLLTLASVHRYAGLVVVVAAVFHFYSLVCTKIGWR